MTATTISELAAKGGTGEATYDDLNRAVEIIKRLPKAALISTALEMGICRRLTTKAAAIDSIKSRLYGPIDARSRCDF